MKLVFKKTFKTVFVLLLVSCVFFGCEVENEAQDVVNQTDNVTNETEAFDCPDLQANIGDQCILQGETMGIITDNCSCQFDNENNGNTDDDSGDDGNTDDDDNEDEGNNDDDDNGDDGNNDDDNEEDDNEETFDCPDMQSNVGDQCWIQNTEGVVTENCDCVEI